MEGVHVDGALDGEDAFGGVFGVFGEVALEEDEGVVVGCSVEFAAVEEGGAVLDGGADGGEGYFFGGGVVAPG